MAFYISNQGQDNLVIDSSGGIDENLTFTAGAEAHRLNDNSIFTQSPTVYSGLELIDQQVVSATDTGAYELEISLPTDYRFHKIVMSEWQMNETVTSPYLQLGTASSWVTGLLYQNCGIWARGNQLTDYGWKSNGTSSADFFRESSGKFYRGSYTPSYTGLGPIPIAFEMDIFGAANASSYTMIQTQIGYSTTNTSDSSLTQAIRETVGCSIEDTQQHTRIKFVEGGSAQTGTLNFHYHIFGEKHLHTT